MLTKHENIESKIIIICGQKVLLDKDLAVLYGVETKVLNQAVKRNLERFPLDFMLQLTKQELAILRSQIVTSSWGRPENFTIRFYRARGGLTLNTQNSND